jgi:RHS repeat-associated protein
MGNRLSKRVSGFGAVGGKNSGFTPAGAFDKTENYDYDACDQLTSFDGAGFEYDMNGNLAKKRDLMAGDMIYKFNYANRLREVLFADGTKAQYSYKSDGMRVSQTDRTGKITNYYWDNSNIPEALNEGDEEGNITLTLFPGTGFKSTRNSSQNSTQWRFFITDHLGSVIALTDNNGIVTDEYEYDEYGTLINTKGTSHNPYKYIGQQYDETTGLIYLRARYYDSETGRFVSRDPIGIKSDLNHYLYTNNPIIYYDILGLRIISIYEAFELVSKWNIETIHHYPPGEITLLKFQSDAFFVCQIFAESSFNNTIVNTKTHATGLMQLLPKGYGGAVDEAIKKKLYTVVPGWKPNLAISDNSYHIATGIWYLYYIGNLDNYGTGKGKKIRDCEKDINKCLRNKKLLLANGKIDTNSVNRLNSDKKKKLFDLLYQKGISEHF